MILDANLVLSNAQLVTVTAVSAGTYDTAGLGIGVAVTNKFGASPGIATSFGQDIGGGGPLATAPQLMVQIATTFSAGGGATMRVQLEAAVDTNNTGVAGTWDIIQQTDDIPVADLVAGNYMARFTVPTRYIGQGFPRFYRVNYLVSTGPMTAGAVNCFLATGIDDLEIYPGAF